MGTTTPSRIQTDVAIIGAGTAGLHALREVRRANKDFYLIDHGPLGTTCARVGCMPSKSALHAAAVWAARRQLTALGVTGVDQLDIDLQAAWAHVRGQRAHFAASAADQARQAAGERLLHGRARLIEPTLIEIETPEGALHLHARRVIIATGSRPVLPRFLDSVRERTVTTDELFDLPTLPRSVGVLGLGAVGLEMGVALARLGVRVIGADQAARVAGISDPQIASRARECFDHLMPLWLGAQARVERARDDVRITAGKQSETVDVLLAALGRQANVDGLDLDEAGIPLDRKGIPVFDRATLQVGKLPIFIAGDANADRPLLHEAADQGAIAGYNACVETPLRFARKVPLGIAFCAPDVVTVGAAWDELDADRIVVGSAEAARNGRAIIEDSTHGLLRVYADAGSGRLLGASMVTAGGEHLGQWLAWAVQQRETARDLLAGVFYHPTLEEMLQSALQDIVRQIDTGASHPLGVLPLAPQDKASAP